MLETVREFGLERLAESGEEAATSRAHADWLLALGDASWRGVEPHFELDWAAKVDADRDNVRAALTWLEGIGEGEGMLRLAGSLSWIWHMHSRRTEARGWLERALELAHGADIPVAVRSRALHAAGFLARNQGDYERATALATECLERSLAVGHAGGAALGHDMLGQVALAQGDYKRAAKHHEQSLALFEAVGSRWSADGSRMMLGVAALGQGELERAREAFESTLAENRRVNNAFGLAWALGYLGLIAARQGELPEGRGPFRGEPAIVAEHRQPGEPGRVAGGRGDPGRGVPISGAVGAALRDSGRPTPRAWSRLPATGTLPTRGGGSIRPRRTWRARIHSRLGSRSGLTLHAGARGGSEVPRQRA